MFSAVKQQIFQSIPKSVVVNSITYNAWVDYADRINVTEKLKDYPIVVTLRYFANRKDERHSPANGILKVTVVDPDLQYVKGERVLVTLSINVHVKSDSAIPAGDIMEEYINQLLLWYLRDLKTIDGIEIAGRSELRDLSYLEDGVLRKQLDLFLRYQMSYEEVITTIESVEHTTTMS